MPEPCHYCGQPVRISKDNHRTMNIQINGRWEHLIWHMECDPFTVRTIVTRTGTRAIPSSETDPDPHHETSPPEV